MATKVITHSDLIRLNQLVNDEIANGWRVVSGGIYNDGRGYYVQVLTDEITADTLPYQMIRFNSAADFEKKSANLLGLPIGTPQLLASNDIVQAFGSVVPGGSYSLPIATDIILGGVKSSSEITVAGDGKMNVGVLPYLNVNNTAPQNKIWLSKYNAGSGHTDAPAAGSVESQYLSIGGREYGLNCEMGIGFGYTSNDVTFNPVFIGYHETNTSSANFGDIVFKTRPTNNNIAPSLRLSITSDGAILAAAGYEPSSDLSLATKKYVDGNSFKRVKSECWFTGLNLVISTTATNLITLIKSLSHTGSLSPFFNTTTDKFNVSNFNTSVNFKINLIGTWSGAATNRSMTIDFPQTNGNSLTKTRDAAVTSDQMSMSTFFSVDKDGNLATNGTDITVKANGADFTVTAILLIAEQLIPL